LIQAISFHIGTNKLVPADAFGLWGAKQPAVNAGFDGHHARNGQRDALVARRSVEIRKSHKIKLPNAIVWATAQVHDRILVTRNTKDVAADEPGVRVPYRL
jgi:hypothetical protein